MICLSSKSFNTIIITLSLILVNQMELVELKAVDPTKPNLLDSFIPASMQIIAHITELMKFDLKPTTTTPTTTTTTIRPTQPHNPGVYAPPTPPPVKDHTSGGATKLLPARGLTFDEYVQRLQQPNRNYFDRYAPPTVAVDVDDLRRESRIERIDDPLDLMIGKGASDLYRLVNVIDDDEDINQSIMDVDGQVQRFSAIYDDDSAFRLVLLREKKTPPTRAYVGLLSLYDLLNKESKKLGLNKYNGYSQSVLEELVDVSSGTSAHQLQSVLSRISQRKDTKNAQIIKRIDELVKDLSESTSYISAALRYIPPLPFAL